MKHYRENGQKNANVRITLDMLPRGVQRAPLGKQMDVLKRMFKRACDSCGLQREMKERKHFIKPGEKRRRAEWLRKLNAGKEEQQQPERRPFDEYNF